MHLLNKPRETYQN